MFLGIFSGNNITTDFTFFQIPCTVSRVQVKVRRRNISVTGNIENCVKQKTISTYNLKTAKQDDADKTFMIRKLINGIYSRSINTSVPLYSFYRVGATCAKLRM